MRLMTTCPCETPDECALEENIVKSDETLPLRGRAEQGSFVVSACTPDLPCDCFARPLKGLPHQSLDRAAADEPEEPHETLCLPPPAEPVAQQPAPQHFSKEWSVSALK